MSELGQGALQVTFKGAELTLDVLVKVFAAILRELGKRDQNIQHGIQSLKSLTAQGNQLTPVNIQERDLLKVANDLKKYQVDFSVMKNESGTEHTLFFKAKDAAVIEHALRQYLDASLLGVAKEPGKELTVTAKDAEDAARSFVQENGKAPEAGTDFGGIIEITAKTATYSKEDTNNHLDYLVSGKRPVAPYSPTVKTEVTKEFFYDRQEYENRVEELKNTPQRQGGIVSGKETVFSVVCEETTRQEALRLEKTPVKEAEKPDTQRKQGQNTPGREAAANGKGNAVQDFLKEKKKQADLFNSKLPKQGPSKARSQGIGR